MIEVIPSSLMEPFIVPNVGNIETISAYFQNECRDPSVALNAIHILSSYLVYIYPEQVSFSKEKLLVIFAYLAKDLLRVKDNDLSALCDKYGLDVDEISEETNIIKEYLKDF